jgi:hypothetical protein
MPDTGVIEKIGIEAVKRINSGLDLLIVINSGLSADDKRLKPLEKTYILSQLQN